MDIVVTAGDNVGQTLRGIYEQDFGPASLFLTYGIAPVGSANPPANWGAAMKQAGHRVWALVQPKVF